MNGQIGAYLEIRLTSHGWAGLVRRLHGHVVAATGAGTNHALGYVALEDALHVEQESRASRSTSMGPCTQAFCQQAAQIEKGSISSRKPVGHSSSEAVGAERHGSHPDKRLQRLSQGVPNTLAK